MKIGPGKIVELDFELLDEDGETCETSKDAGPMVYLHGEEEIPPALEAALEGLEVGARLALTLEPDEAFGEVDLEAIFSVPRTELPPDVELVPGDWIALEVTIEDDEGGGGSEPTELEARVVELDDEAVVLDPNHPLAGQRVTFHVEVLAVRVPEADE